MGPGAFLNFSQGDAFSPFSSPWNSFFIAPVIFSASPGLKVTVYFLWNNKRVHLILFFCPRASVILGSERGGLFGWDEACSKPHRVQWLRLMIRLEHCPNSQSQPQGSKTQSLTLASWLRPLCACCLLSLDPSCDTGEQDGAVTWILASPEVCWFHGNHKFCNGKSKWDGGRRRTWQAWVRR